MSTWRLIKISGVSRVNIGFIGTGGITEAMIHGMVGCLGHADPVWVSRRSSERSARLAAKYSTVNVLDENQAIVDRSDWVVLAVLPRQAEGVIDRLEFRASQTIISLVAGLEVAALRRHVSPCENVCRMIPLPPIEYAVGPLPVYPGLSEVVSFFERLGTVVPVEDESCFNVFSANSGLMANFFEWTAAQARWMEEQGVSPESASRYASAFVYGLASLVQRSPVDQLQSMSDECLTPGGLNEQVLNESREMGWFEMLRPSLDSVLKRLQR